MQQEARRISNIAFLKATGEWWGESMGLPVANKDVQSESASTGLEYVDQRISVGAFWGNRKGDDESRRTGKV